MRRRLLCVIPLAVNCLLSVTIAHSQSAGDVPLEASTSQLKHLFDDIIRKTERREAFSDVKERIMSFSALEDMKKLHSEFAGASTVSELYYALVKLSNARRDRHLRVSPVDGGLSVPQPSGGLAPIHVLPDLSDVANPVFFVAAVGRGYPSVKPGDVVVGVNGRSMAEYVKEFTHWVTHSTLHGLYWRMAFELPRRAPNVPLTLYSEQLDLTLERPTGERYSVSLPYCSGCGVWGLDGPDYREFTEVMRRENFIVRLDRNRRIILLDWRDFEYSLIQDMIDLMAFAAQERILDYDMIIDVTYSSGGSRGAYAIQRLVDKPFRTTFGNVRLSDAGKTFIEWYRDREPDRNAPDIFGLNLSRSWLIDWARTDATEAIRRGDEYTPAVPFKLAHLPKDSDGILQTAPVHFRGRVVIVNGGVWGGSHLDQFVAMFADNDLAVVAGMPTGGFSNTWEHEEILYLPGTTRPLVEFMWSIGHTIRPNGEDLEGNPAQPDVYIPLTRENHREYYRILLDTAINALDGDGLYPYGLAILSGDAQQGAAGSVLADSLGVQVRDQLSDPLPGATVTFTVTAGDGMLSATTVTTDENGRASAALTLGDQPGTNRVVATVANLDPVTFTAIATSRADFDGDGTVGFSDFVQFAGKFGLGEGDEGYDARFDLDGNGAIVFSDFLIFAAVFGKEREPADV